MFITSAIVFAFKIRHKAIKHRFVLELEMQHYNILKLECQMSVETTKFLQQCVRWAKNIFYVC